MRIRLGVVILVLLGLAAPHAQQQARVISGRVVDAATGAPIQRARIGEVRSPGSAAPFVEPVLTNERGEFELAGAPLVIEVFKAGYARTNAPTDAAKPVEIKLPHGAAITGRVIDRAGAPVSTVSVGVFEIAGAIESTRPSGNVITNDLGEYRVGDLKAGRYHVRFTDNSFASGAVVDVRTGDEIEVMPETRPVPCRDVEGPPLPASSTGRATIKGRVTTASNLPLACATVTIIGPGAPQRRVNTDAQGRYAFTDLRAGPYTVTAVRAGYTVLQFGQQRSGEDGKVVKVADGGAANGIDIALPRGSAITGTITDDVGDPVEGAVVRVLKLTMIEGRQTALPPQGAAPQRSDDRGRYRLYGLLPGRYLVVAASDDGINLGMAPGGQMIVETRPGIAAGFPSTPMLYPGTPDPSLAALLTVEPGHDIDGIDIPLRRLPTATVTGKAFDSDGQPLRTGVLLAVSQRSGSIVMEPRTTRVNADGSFAFRGVPPADYVLQAMAPRPGSAPDFVAEYLHVVDGDPAPVVLRTSPGPTLEGRIVREGPADARDRFMVMPFPVDFDRSPMIGMGPVGITVQPDGTYRAAGMSGVRRMVLAGPDGWYLKSVTLNGRDITDEAYDFGARPAVFSDLQIVVSNASATIGGDVRERGNPVESYAVVLFSTDRSHWFRNSRHNTLTRPDADGRFRLSGIAPGDYYLAAVDVLDGGGNTGEWQDPAVLESLTHDARRVSLGESQQATYSLTLQRR